MSLCDVQERKDDPAPLNSPAAARRRNRKRPITSDHATASEETMQEPVEPPGSAASSVSSAATTLPCSPSRDSAATSADRSDRHKLQRRDQSTATAKNSSEHSFCPTSFQPNGAVTENEVRVPSQVAQQAPSPLSAPAAVSQLAFSDIESDTGRSTDDEARPTREAAHLQPPPIQSSPQDLVKLSIQRSAMPWTTAAPKVEKRAPAAATTASAAAVSASPSNFVSPLPLSIQARYSRSICCRHVVVAFSIFQCKQAAAGRADQMDPLAPARQLRQQQQIELHLQQEQQRLTQQRLMIELQQQQLASFQRVMASPLPSFQHLSQLASTPCTSFSELNLSSPLNSSRASLVHTKAEHAPSAPTAAAASSAHVAASPSQPSMPGLPNAPMASSHLASPARAPRSSMLSVSPHLPPSPAAARPPLARLAHADPCRATSRRPSAAGISPPGALAPSVLAVVNACSTGALTSASMASATAGSGLSSTSLSPSSPPGRHMELVTLKAVQARELQQGMQGKDGKLIRLHESASAAAGHGALPAPGGSLPNGQSAAMPASAGDTVPASATSDSATPPSIQSHHSTALTRLMQLANQRAPTPPSPTSLARAGHYLSVHQPIRPPPARRSKHRAKHAQCNPDDNSKQRLCRT